MLRVTLNYVDQGERVGLPDLHAPVAVAHGKVVPAWGVGHAQGRARVWCCTTLDHGEGGSVEELHVPAVVAQSKVFFFFALGA